MRQEGGKSLFARTDSINESIGTAPIRRDGTETPCPHADRCGGCTYQTLPYEEQLRLKNAQVLELLLQYGVICGSYEGVRPSPRICAYRNKMEYSFGDEEKDGPMTLGLHRKKSYMSVLNTDGCRFVPEDFNTIRRAALSHMTDRGHSFRHKRTRRGFLRNLVIRRGENTGELLVNLVTTDEETLDEQAFVELLLNLKLNDTPVGILHTVYCGRADTVGCDRAKTLYGRDYYRERMLDLEFNVNAFSFFQTNTSAVEAMFASALSLMPGAAEKTIFDLYCGTGAISLALARTAKSVIGIELSADSIRAARENAARNGVANCSFLEGDALEVLERLPHKPDAIVADPPRMGIHPKALKKIIAYGLDELLYISCNPKTFCENMAVFQENGYKLDALCVCDNFPFTKHIELFSRIKKRGGGSPPG
ncbi:MAG: 23S rRNA (uracil(1939)-C(5))-methyltransferase RlmD [Clostridiales Family XIII bacterium]|jgi:23S rRNA (uracil-5-)-methyltransferase RumA|nr:23S rRNA (uracil(1939)-C(5))-methyltransferase RlmD [Clostridiales Family XIII bacterium]